MKTIESGIELKPAKNCSGIVRIPASKSHAQRALACALLSDKQTVLRVVGNSNDERVLLGLLHQSAANIRVEEDCITIAAGNKLYFDDTTIQFGESGLAARMCTPILANCNQQLSLTGNGSLTERPMSVFSEILPLLGVEYSDNEGKLPIQLNGPLVPADLEIDGSLSSQFITGILYGIAGSNTRRETQLRLTNPVSLPYIDLSIDVLRQFGAQVKRTANCITIAGPVQWKTTELEIEGDWSSASFLLVLAAISGTITITNLNRESLQADRKITEVLEVFGANVSWNESELTVSKLYNKAFRFDATHCPDLFPPLAVLACFGDAPSAISGVHRLVNKESNRAQTLQSELGKLGIVIRFEQDDMIIEPVKEIQSVTVDSCNDHRIAMACALVLLKGKTPGTITRFEAVNKSFPDFFHYIKKLTTP